MEFLVPLLFTIIGFILPIIYNYFFSRYLGTRHYDKRDVATSNMISDMIKSSEMIFIGITHSKLIGYFEKAFERNRNKALSWQKINIYFPNNEYGYNWNEEFGREVCVNILAIANYLVNNRKEKLPDLREINFFRTEKSIGISGSLFKYKKSNDLNIIYDVRHSLLGNNNKTEVSRTIRINKKYKKHKVFFKRYLECYSDIIQNKIILHKIDLNLKNYWDESSTNWDYFENQFGIYHSIMSVLISKINFTNTNYILSLGAGTGELERKIIKEKKYRGFISLVDNSHSMLYEAYKKLRNNKNVNFTLLDLSIPEWQFYGVLSNIKYDYILIHFSLHHFINTGQQLYSFACKLKSLLAPQGIVLIAIHDNIYEGPKPDDKLREVIISFAQKEKIRIKSGLSLSITELKQEFALAKLNLVQEETTDSYKRSMSDRIAMWKTPAILNTLIDFDSLTKETKDELFNRIEQVKGDNLTPGTIVKFFRYDQSIIVSAAIIQNEKKEILVVMKDEYYLLPGGVIELNENSEDALIRELHEELQVEKKDIGKIVESCSISFDKAYLEEEPLKMIIHKCEISSSKLKSLSPDLEISNFRWLNRRNYKYLPNMPQDYFDKIFKELNIELPDEN